MEFIKANLLNTTTQVAVNSNTLSVSNLFNRNTFYQYYSDGLASDSLTASITVTFDSTTSVSRISLLGLNSSSFNLFYNGATANAFSLSNADTTTSIYSTNTDENKYLRFNTIACSSITLELKSTFVANSEKVIGLMLISDLMLDTPIIPSAKNYNPKKSPKQIVHMMSDGGKRIHNIAKKWSLDIGLDYISSSFKDSLEDIYDLGSEFNFCPFGTATGWDGFVFESTWEGAFDFYEYSDNAQVSGFSGMIRLRETPI